MSRLPTGTSATRLPWRGRSPGRGSVPQYENASLAEQAAVLCHGIVQSHPFVDGNKRCATVAILTFLRLNDVDLGVDDDVLFAWM